jgi:hypothetical protein
MYLWEIIKLERSYQLPVSRAIKIGNILMAYIVNTFDQIISNKMKINEYNIVTTFPKSNSKIVERGKMDTL